MSSKDDRIGMLLSKEIKERFLESCGTIPYTRMIIALMRMFMEMSEDEKSELVKKYLLGLVGLSSRGGSLTQIEVSGRILF